MNNLVKKLIECPLPIVPEIAIRRANCFNAIQLFCGDSDYPTFVGPEEFVMYIQNHFQQLDRHEISKPQDISIIWSRNSNALPLGQIRIDSLKKEKAGYPFGLIIEYSFVSLESKLVFQKRDPTATGPYEVVSEQSALSSYIPKNGFEVTRHRKV